MMDGEAGHNRIKATESWQGLIKIVLNYLHVVTHERKRSLYSEIHAALEPGGIFCNLEHLASATANLRGLFLRALRILDSRWGHEAPTFK